MKLLLFPAIIILFTATSCRKVYDFIRDHPDAHDSLCQVTVITFNGGEKYFISYNEKGNPMTMLGSSRASYTNLDRYYRYDRFDRLSDYMGVYPGNFGAIYWHKYDYTRPGFITDTAMFYETGDIRGPSPIAKNAAEYYIYGYTLDAHGRIVKIWSIPNDPPHTPVLQSELHYDAKGNLSLSSPDLSYDDKVNPYRTNKVWQFIYQDYSRNNVVKNDYLFFTDYNSFGLPLKVRNFQSYNIYAFDVNNIYASQMELTYACAPPKGPVNY